MSMTTVARPGREPDLQLERGAREFSYWWPEMVYEHRGFGSELYNLAFFQGKLWRVEYAPEEKAGPITLWPLDDELNEAYQGWIASLVVT